MEKEKYELYLLKKVDWWLCIKNVEDIYTNEKIHCYHGDVFGVRTIMECSILEKLAKKHNVDMPHCIVGG